MGISEFPDAIASRRHLLGTAAILVMVFVGSLRLFEFLWHRDALADIARQPGGWRGAIIVVACSAVVHELLHGFAWHTFARVPWQSISFRPSWRVMGFVAHATVAVPAPAYRASAALPALVLGVVPIVLGFGTGFGLFVLRGLFTEWSRTAGSLRPNRTSPVSLNRVTLAVAQAKHHSYLTGKRLDVNIGPNRSDLGARARAHIHMIVISQNAASQIHKMLAKNGLEGGGLRIGLKAGGCSGYEYTFAWEKDARGTDQVFTGPGDARIFVDPKSYALLQGTELDYDTSLMSRGFMFNNPNAKSTCGCGLSFNA